MNTNQLSRRNFVKTAALFAAATAGPAFAASRKGRKLPVGLQLYAVREEFSRDVPGTLRRAATIGYQGVEFWGYGGTPNVFQNYSAKQLRDLLKQNKLRCCGMHMDLKAIQDANFERTVENNEVLGNKFLIVAAAKDKMSSLAGIKELAEALNTAAAKAKKEKMRVGYHAHGFDFEKIEGRFAWDHLFSQVNPEVVMQMDVGNALGGGGDPLGMLKKFPGRALTIHIKEFQDKTFASPYYTEVFQICETAGKTEWYIVEAGGANGLGFEIPTQALTALKAIGK